MTDEAQLNPKFFLKKWNAAFRGVEPLISGPITFWKYLCRNIAPERMIRAQLNLILKKKLNKIKCCYKGLKPLFRDAIIL